MDPWSDVFIEAYSVVGVDSTKFDALDTFDATKSEVFLDGGIIDAFDDVAYSDAFEALWNSSKASSKRPIFERQIARKFLCDIADGFFICKL